MPRKCRALSSYSSTVRREERFGRQTEASSGKLSASSKNTGIGDLKPQPTPSSAAAARSDGNLVPGHAVIQPCQEAGGAAQTFGLRASGSGVNGSAEGDLAFVRCGSFLQEKGPFEVYDKKAPGVALLLASS